MLTQKTLARFLRQSQRAKRWSYIAIKSGIRNVNIQLYWHSVLQPSLVHWWSACNRNLVTVVTIPPRAKWWVCFRRIWWTSPVTLWRAGRKQSLGPRSSRSVYSVRLLNVQHSSSYSTPASYNSFTDLHTKCCKTISQSYYWHEAWNILKTMH